jgi:hypothetical protein
MATLNAEYPTLLDLSQLPKNSMASDVINLLAQINPILEDAPAFECNHGMKHKTTVMTGLPAVTWGRLYKGIPASKGTRQIVEDATGFVESASEVDCRLVDQVEKAEEKASIRMSEAEAHIEAMAIEVASAMFYADSSVDPEKPMGFAPRFNSLSAENGQQIIDGNGAGADNTSIWMITWGRQASHIIYPKAGNIGLERDDQGKQLVEDASGDKYMVYREEFKWHFGLTVRNWQYVARVANIDVSNLTTNASSGADIVELMTEMYYAHKGRRVASGRTFIYANTTIVKFLDYQARNASAKNLYVTLSEQGPNAKEVLSFRGVPIREVDALLNTEAVVS